MEQLTLSYLLTEDMICLALKKRGFGAGNWNGYGGKLEAGESILAGAVREIEEESCVRVHTTDLTQVGIMEFIFTDGTHLEVHTFFTRVWEGEPQETDEMRPAWFSFNAIPYDTMWADDRHWLPRALAGERLRGRVWFDETGKEIADMEWTAVTDFS